MTKIFWVTCPQCKGEFYCHWQELRHKKIKLLCPYCSHQFLDEESSEDRRVRIESPKMILDFRLPILD